MKNFDWAAIKTSDKYKPLIKSILDKAKEFENEPIPILPYSLFSVYYKTGSRLEYEREYFKRRQRLNVYAVLSLIYNEPYIQKLQDSIWLICDEACWGLPAHISTELDMREYEEYIDLFAAETGFTLSEILYLLEDKLDELVKKRVVDNINRRIFESFEKTHFFWENCNSNWAAVCAGSVGACYLYQDKNRFEVVKDRILSALNNYLSGFLDDGCCTEGLGYWNYGFGYFVYFADLYKKAYGIDLLNNEKVENIACFQQKVYLYNETAVSFADSAIKCFYLGGLTDYLCKRFPSVERPSDLARAGLFDEDCNRWQPFIRNIMWIDDAHKQQSNLQFHYFKDTQWYINKKGMQFAAKGGHNAEHHNHNDVGSFILVNDGEIVIADLGAGEYNAAYFGKERYNILCNSSRGHSVPIINGQYQKSGASYRAEVLHYDENSFKFEMAAAYDLDILKSLVREFYIDNDEVALKDSFVFETEPKSVSSRLVSLTKPQKDKETVFIGNIAVICDGLKVEIHEEKHVDHFKNSVVVYLIDISPKEMKRNIEINLRILKKR